MRTTWLKLALAAFGFVFLLVYCGGRVCLDRAQRFLSGISAAGVSKNSCGPGQGLGIEIGLIRRPGAEARMGPFAVVEGQVAAEACAGL